MTRAGLAGHRLEHSRSGGGNDLPLADFAEFLSHLLAERLKHPFVAINPQECESPLDELLEGLAVGITQIHTPATGFATSRGRLFNFRQGLLEPRVLELHRDAE